MKHEIKSTNYNLTNPLEVIDIDINTTNVLPPNIYNCKIQHCTKNYYDLIAIKDPYTIYIINDNGKYIRYMGDIEIIDTCIERRYFITNGDNNDYIIYINNPKMSNGLLIDNLQEICKFNDINLAIESLNKFNIIGSNYNLSLQIDELLMNYIRDEILSLNELILGIISIFGYKDHPVLQILLYTSMMFQSNKNIDNVSKFVIELSKKEYIINEYSYIYTFYKQLYLLLLSYDLLNDIDYNEPNSVYQEIITKILNIMILR